MSGSDPDARDKEEPQWARLVRAMMREKCTEGKGGKGERRADDGIVRFILTLDEKGKHTITQNKAE